MHREIDLIKCVYLMILIRILLKLDAILLITKLFVHTFRLLRPRFLIWFWFDNRINLLQLQRNQRNKTQRIVLRWVCYLLDRWLLLIMLFYTFLFWNNYDITDSLKKKDKHQFILLHTDLLLKRWAWRQILYLCRYESQWNDIQHVWHGCML